MARTRMALSKRRPLIREIFLVGFLLHAFAAHAVSVSAITSDGTLGTKVTQGGTTFDITGGTRNGANLFHSLGLFSVGTGDTANFLNDTALATTNILGRITGGEVSSIFGTIKTTNFGAANLFLINPAGWVFGSTASLNVGGSFHVSTADYLKFADGAKFHADLSKQSTLTSAPVSAFGFLSQTPAGISIQGSSLQVPNGQTLSLVGGDITVVGDPSLSVATLSALGGNINLASVASPGEVPVNVQDVNVAAFTRLGEINLSNFAVLDVTGNGGGTVIIRGGRFVADSSFILANNLGDIDTNAPGVDIHVAQDAVITQSLIQTHSLGAGHGRNLQVTAESMQIDNSLIGSSPFGSGNGGNVTLDVVNLTLTGMTQIFSDTFGSGNGGDIAVRAENVTVTGEGRVSSTTFRAGKGGTVRITATDTINLDGRSGISAGSGSNSTGSSGDVVMEAENLTMSGEAKVSSTTFGPGKGGTVRITATDTINLDGRSGISAGSGSNSAGSPGDIVMEAKNVAVTGDALIESATLGSGNGGRVKITAADTISLGADGAITTVAVEGSAGNAGDISVEAKSVKVTGQISSDTFGSGNGGTLRVTASDTISLDGVRSLVSASSASTGNAGDIRVEAKNVVVTHGAQISGSTFADGSGGSVEVRADQVNLKDDARIKARSSGGGNAGNIVIQANEFRSANSFVTTQADTADGGNIHLTAGKLVDLVNSQITATVKGGFGSGGNITIDPTFVVLNNSQITANAFGGPGGNITIIADHFLASPDSAVTASSALSTPGTVDIQAAITNLSGFLEPLPENIFQATSLLRQSCAARFSGGKLSSFVVGARDGLPFEPGGFMPSPLYRMEGQPVRGPSDSAQDRLQSDVGDRRAELGHCATITISDT